jgi:hypothetical protein
MDIHEINKSNTDLFKIKLVRKSIHFSTAYVFKSNFYLKIYKEMRKRIALNEKEFV